jgi:murein tripeptide amidase MpaA
LENNEFDSYKKNVNFVVIPFVNLDGVKYGNQKTNLAGINLDKIWKNPN